MRVTEDRLIIACRRLTHAQGCRFCPTGIVVGHLLHRREREHTVRLDVGVLALVGATSSSFMQEVNSARQVARVKVVRCFMAVGIKWQTLFRWMQGGYILTPRNHTRSG